MKYYSENTRKFYDSEQECAQAEIEYNKKRICIFGFAYRKSYCYQFLYK